MITYEALNHTKTEVLHRTFTEAFSDYRVPMRLPLWEFRQMLQRRGYRPELSVGAFENDRLIGFVLNGMRGWNGVPTAYDVGTGVIGAFRERGISSKLFTQAGQLLKERGIEQYLLEVLQSNRAAVLLYEKQGFRLCREFSCFQIGKEKLVPSMKYRAEKADGLSSEQDKVFWDFVPSWQNSRESVCAVPEGFYRSAVRIGQTVVGYGVIEKRTGNIAQLAVRREDRRTGVAGSILADLAKNTAADRITVLNVDTSCKAMEAFLLAAGFECFALQYEMLLNL